MNDSPLLPDPETDDIEPIVPVPLAAPLAAAEPEPEIPALVADDDEPAVAIAYDDAAEDATEAYLPPVHLPAVPLDRIDLPTIDSNSSHNKEKAAAVFAAVLVHLGLALLLGVLIVVVPGPPSSEITAISAPATQEQAPTTQKIAEPPPQQSVSQPMASMKFMTATNASAVPMPAVEFDPNETTLDLGTTMGSFDANFAGAGTGTVMMFGKQISARKIAVVMDVSRSMTRYLPEVVKELKKVGRDSALVLYFGCWLTPVKDLEKVHPVGGEEFDKFWQYWQGKQDFTTLGNEYHKMKYDPKMPMPLEDVYKQVAKRKETYFIDRYADPKNRSTSVMSAILAKEIRDADTIYWFADFMDRVDDETAAEVVKKLRARNRKLFIHAPHDRGPSLAKVKEKMVAPLGGEAIILDIK
jgi:hypothetical protein